MRKKVALLVESSRAYGRGLLAGIAAYARAHRHWSIYHHERMLGESVPKWLESWTMPMPCATRCGHPYSQVFV